MALFLLFFVGICMYFEFVVCPVVVENTRQMVLTLSTSAMSDAVYDVLKEENVSYNDLVDIVYDEKDCIKFINLQTIKLNMIARRFYQVAQKYLDKMGDDGVDVALGTFTGIPFLSGLGPKINLKLVSIGAITSTFESVFVSAGINQTNHSVFVKLFASVSMIIPVYKSNVDSVTEVLLAESVIVGDVPKVYLNNDGIST